MMLTRRMFVASIAKVAVPTPNVPDKPKVVVQEAELKNAPLIYDIEEVMKDVEVLQRKVMDDELCIQLLYAQAMVMIFLNIFRR